MHAEMHQMLIFRIAGIGFQRLPLAQIVRSANTLVQFAILSNRANFHTDATGKSVFSSQFLMVDRAGNSVEIRSNPTWECHQRPCRTEPSAKLAIVTQILLKDTCACELCFCEQRYIPGPRPEPRVDQVVTEALHISRHRHG